MLKRTRVCVPSRDLAATDRCLAVQAEAALRYGIGLASDEHVWAEHRCKEAPDTAEVSILCCEHETLLVALAFMDIRTVQCHRMCLGCTRMCAERCCPRGLVCRTETPADTAAALIARTWACRPQPVAKMSGQRRLFLSNALRVSSNWLSQAALTHQAGAVGAHTFASISSQPAEEQHASLASTSALPSYLSWAAASEQVATSSGRGEGGPLPRASQASEHVAREPQQGLNVSSLFHYAGFKLALPNSPFAASGRRGRPSPKLILYKGPYLLLFRFLVRGKVFQLLGVFLAAMVIAAAFTAPVSKQRDHPTM